MNFAATARCAIRHGSLSLSDLQKNPSRKATVKDRLSQAVKVAKAYDLGFKCASITRNRGAAPTYKDKERSEAFIQGFTEGTRQRLAKRIVKKTGQNIEL